MKASLILCSRNGGNRLEKCLAAINAMDLSAALDLVLVDNGSTDGVSFGTMSQFVAESNFPCTVLSVAAPGNSSGRNAAIDVAQGELLLFIDDDCYVARDFAQHWLSVFAERKIGFASGMVGRFDSRHSDLGCNESVEETFLRAGRFFGRGVIQGSNLAFRRDCLRDAGLFDPRFGAGTAFAGEEWDLALRASAAGWAGGYFPAPKVLHDHRRSGAAARDRLLFYDYGAGAVYAKHMTGAGWFSITPRLGRDAYRLRGDKERLHSLLSGYSAYRRLSKRLE